MTYCLGIRLDAGLVFLSDSRTNAGMDQISTFRKMMVYERPGDRFMALLSAGNLSISQSVRELLQVERIDGGHGGHAGDVAQCSHVGCVPCQRIFAFVQADAPDHHQLVFGHAAGLAHLCGPVDDHEHHVA